ncbi:MAG: helix-turn-helix domain-containing protein [Vampirovibrionia bacterium]
MINTNVMTNSLIANYTYQHIQGIMLLNLNKLASKIKLSHSEYRVICTLIGLYNKNTNKAFPTIEYLASTCCMGKSTIIKCLNSLVENNLLIVVKTPGKRNNYYFSNNILIAQSTPHVEPERRTSCKTVHDYKPINNITNKNQSLFNQNDDVTLKTTDINEFKAILNKLNTWHYSGAKKLLKQKSLKEIKKLIDLVEKHNPDNKGAYLRSLVKEFNGNIHHKQNSLEISLEYTQIKQMIKQQYWKHIPTNKVLKVKPDIGSHLLIRYYKNENMVEFIECGLIDKLENFESYDS